MARQGYRSTSLREEDYIWYENEGVRIAKELNLAEPLSVPAAINYIRMQYEKSREAAKVK